LLKTKDVKSCIVFLLIFSMMLSGFNFSFANDFSDIGEHWAKNEIKAWIEKELIEGYSDGTFRPDNNITRAEFITLINRAFGYTKEDIINFPDVSSDNWFYSEIAKAKAAGYISGYPDGTMKPNNSISRQEAAGIVVRILDLGENINAAEKFADYSKIPAWSRGYIGTVLEAKIMEGYPDGTFKAEDFITRAEAVITLERAMEIESDVITYDKSGTYGPLEGIETIDKNVLISADGVILQNVLIKGNLTLDKGIGDGEVTLKNVTVKKDTFIYGGGENSVIFRDCALEGTVTIEKADGRIRIVAEGTTSVSKAVLQSGAILLSEGEGLFSRVELPKDLSKDTRIVLTGNFGGVEIAAKEVSVKVGEGSVLESLVFTKDAADAEVDLDKETSIAIVKTDAKIKITGQGSIGKVEINVDGVLVEQKPEEIVLKPGVKANIGGEDISEKSDGSGGPTTDPVGTAKE